MGWEAGVRAKGWVRVRATFGDVDVESCAPRDDPKVSTPLVRVTPLDFDARPLAMGACLCRLLCCRRAKPANEYKKLDARSAGPIDLEGGQMGDDEDWDDFTPQEAVAGPSQPAVEEEPEAEPEPDPVAEAFADMGMAPVITKTKRHVAVNPWAERGPVSSSLAMAMDDDGGGDSGAGWEDAGDTLDLRAERRKQAEERVARGGSGRAQKTTASQKNSRRAAVRARARLMASPYSKP